MVAPPLPHTARQSRTILPVFGAAVVATALYAAWLAWQIGGEDITLYVSDGGTVLAPLIAMIACFRAGARREPRLRTFWWLLAAACGSWMVGEMIWVGYDLTGGEGPPIPSWADVGYLLFIPLAVAALLSHPGMRGSGIRKARSLFDALSIAVALLFLSWTFVLGPIWRGSDMGTPAGFMTLVYPAGDVVIGFFVMLALRRMHSAHRVGLWFLLGGLISLAVADSLFAYVVEVQGYTSGNLLDTGWFAGFLAIGLGAYACKGRDLADEEESSLLALPSLLAPLLPVFVALIVVGITLDVEQLNDRAGLAMVFILMLLAFLRQLLLVVDLLRLARRDGHGSLFDSVARVALRRDSRPVSVPRSRGRA